MQFDSAMLFHIALVLFVWQQEKYRLNTCHKVRGREHALGQARGEPNRPTSGTAFAGIQNQCRSQRNGSISRN